MTTRNGSGGTALAGAMSANINSQGLAGFSTFNGAGALSAGTISAMRALATLPGSSLLSAWYGARHYVTALLGDNAPALDPAFLHSAATLSNKNQTITGDGTTGARTSSRSSEQFPYDKSADYRYFIFEVTADVAAATSGIGACNTSQLTTDSLGGTLNAFSWRTDGKIYVDGVEYADTGLPWTTGDALRMEYPVGRAVDNLDFYFYVNGVLSVVDPLTVNPGVYFVATEVQGSDVLTVKFGPRRSFVTQFDSTILASGVVLSNKGRTAERTSGGVAAVMSTRTELNTGGGTVKLYCEFTADSLNSANVPGVGMSTTQSVLEDMKATTKACMLGADGNFYCNSVSVASGIGTWGTGDVIGMAVNTGTNKIWFRKNGNGWNGAGGANPETSVGGLDYSAVALGATSRAAIQLCSNGDKITVNFGPNL